MPDTVNAWGTFQVPARFEAPAQTSSGAQRTARNGARTCLVFGRSARASRFSRLARRRSEDHSRGVRARRSREDPAAIRALLCPSQGSWAVAPWISNFEFDGGSVVYMLLSAMFVRLLRALKLHKRCKPEQRDRPNRLLLAGGTESWPCRVSVWGTRRKRRRHPLSNTRWLSQMLAVGLIETTVATESDQRVAALVALLLGDYHRALVTSVHNPLTSPKTTRSASETTPAKCVAQRQCAQNTPCGRCSACRKIALRAELAHSVDGCASGAVQERSAAAAAILPDSAPARPRLRSHKATHSMPSADRRD